MRDAAPREGLAGTTATVQRVAAPTEAWGKTVGMACWVGTVGAEEATVEMVADSATAVGKAVALAVETATGGLRQ